MEETLYNRLSDFITENNPEMIVNAGRSFSLSQFVNDRIESVSQVLKELTAAGKAEEVILETCMKEMTKDLVPSRANYIRAILKDEFPHDHDRFSETGVLTYEVVNLLEVCAEVFENYEFNEKNQGSRFLRYAVIAVIQDYLIDRA